MINSSLKPGILILRRRLFVINEIEGNFFASGQWNIRTNSGDIFAVQLTNFGIGELCTNSKGGVKWGISSRNAGYLPASCEDEILIIGILF